MYHMIFDPAAQSITMLMDAQHMAMQMAIPSPTPATTAAANSSKVTRTGKHETIAGYDCEDWDIATDNGTHTTCCVATGLAFFDFQAMSHAGGGAPAWIDELRGKNGFPLRAVTTGSDGKETTRMEVTKVEKKSVDDAQFVVPADYKMMQMPSFAGGALHGMPPQAGH